MKLATWNVNSIRTRLPRLLAWIERHRPDVMCLQETKVVNEDFPAAELSALGYQSLIHGQRAYNGVAILSRAAPLDSFCNLPDDEPGASCRLLTATIEGIRLIDAYAPNGQAVGSDKYKYKLEWYRRLRAFLDSSFDPGSNVLLCGDLNVAPEDRDVWDPRLWRGRILFSEPEKASFRNIVEWGFIDAFRMHHPDPGLFTWWDYRAGAFRRNMGLRIDHILVSPPLAKRCVSVEVDREERKGEKPSDHAPVIAMFE
jgi:exodeoxyribonuclease-3